MKGGGEMRQYCRYCSFLTTGNGIYCNEKKKTMSEASAKSVNRCKLFDLNPMDAFDLDKTYKPREVKQRQCDGQIEMFG